MSIFLHQNRARITLSRPQPARKEGLLPPCLERTGSAQADGDEILAREMAAVVITTTAGPGQRVFAAAASRDLLAAGSPAWLAV